MGLFPRSIEEYVALAGVPRGPLSKIYLVDAVNGDDGNPGTSFQQPMATVEAAEAACTAGQHDVVLLLANATAQNLTAVLTWDKAYTHLLGMCAPTHVSQRARIFQGAAVTAVSPSVNITASGCMFKNVMLYQGVANAGNLLNVQVTGGRNYFENVHFAAPGAADHAINTGAALKLNAAEENLFKGCTIGLTTIALATGYSLLLVDGDAARNKFVDCDFVMRAGATTAYFGEMVDGTSILDYLMFDGCQFVNVSTTNAVGTAFLFVNPNADRRILMKNCTGYGLGAWDTTNTDVVLGDMGTPTALDLSGVALAMDG